MARVFKHTYTKPLPGEAQLFTRKGKRYARLKDGKKVVIETAKWYIEYKDADGIMRRVPGCKDKQATAKMASDLESTAERERTGLIDRHATQRQRPLAEHLTEWEIDLQAKGNTHEHVLRSVRRAREVLEGCHFQFWPDVSASPVQAYLGELHKSKNGKLGLSARTVNDYLRSIKQFMGWLVKDDRTPHSPLAHLQRLNAKTDIRYQRRPLSADECRALINAAQTGPTRDGLAGPRRAMLYRLAMETGFRLGELRSLIPNSFDLEGKPPTVTVQAAYSKHRREDVQPIPQKLANDLRGFLDGHPTEKRLFGKFCRAGEAVRNDLASVGIASRDSAGRVADFHSLRHTFITNLTKAGVAPKVAMDLAHHASVDLTMNYYSHTVVADRADALGVLPDLTDGSDKTQPMRLTGTYDGRGSERAFSDFDNKHSTKLENSSSGQLSQPLDYAKDNSVPTYAMQGATYPVGSPPAPSEESLMIVPEGYQ